MRKNKEETHSRQGDDGNGLDMGYFWRYQASMTQSLFKHQSRHKNLEQGTLDGESSIQN